MATRSQRKAKDKEPVQNNSSSLKRVENSWLLLAKNSLLDNSTFNIVTLAHPAHGQPAKFCLDDENKKIFEVVTFSEPHRSWFIGETVKSDGSLQILTPINPLFLGQIYSKDLVTYVQEQKINNYIILILVLPGCQLFIEYNIECFDNFLVLPRLKEQCSSKAIPLEDLLSEKGFNKILEFVINIDAIADLKGPPDLKAYKYNEEKTLTWLEERVRKLANVLRERNIHVTSGAVSATFVTSNLNNTDIDEDFYLKYAHGLISEYLQEDLVNKLEQRFNFKPDLIETIGKKRKSEPEDRNENKKIKRENSDSDQKGDILLTNHISPEVKKPKTLSAKEKARQKAASGTKTISSFFTKK